MDYELWWVWVWEIRSIDALCQDQPTSAPRQSELQAIDGTLPAAAAARTAAAAAAAAPDTAAKQPDQSTMSHRSQGTRRARDETKPIWARLLLLLRRRWLPVLLLLLLRRRLPVLLLLLRRWLPVLLLLRRSLILLQSSPISRRCRIARRRPQDANANQM
jgi:hypothetical protein